MNTVLNRDHVTVDFTLHRYCLLTTLADSRMQLVKLTQQYRPAVRPVRDTQYKELLSVKAGLVALSSFDASQVDFMIQTLCTQ